MLIQRVGAVLLSCCVVASASAPKLVITEIMYDPTSSESDDQQTEWVEIQNVGGESVSLQGLQLTSGTRSRPKDAKQRHVLGDVELPPGGFVVIGIGSAKSYAGLGLPPFAAHCDEAKYAWLTNGGDSIAIRDTKNEVIDQVIYSADAPWPAAGRNGSSIQFVPPAGADPQQANDDPKNWVSSGAGNSDDFKNHGRGTPGRATPEPSNKSPTTRPAQRR